MSSKDFYIDYDGEKEIFTAWMDYGPSKLARRTHVGSEQGVHTGYGLAMR